MDPRVKSADHAEHVEAPSQESFLNVAPPTASLPGLTRPSIFLQKILGFT
jgi:hypothetical protein